MRGRRGVGSVDSLSSTSRSHAGGGLADGALLLILGAGFVIFWFMCFMTQITTNEAFIDHAKNINVYRPNLGIFVQIPMLMLGQIPADEITGVVSAWAIVMILLALTIGGFEMIHNAVHQSGRILGIIFEIIAFGVVCFNWYTDYYYGAVGSNTDWGHVFFACITSVVVAYFLVIGWYLLRAGWARA